MKTKKYIFYATDWNPNGTSALGIYDAQLDKFIHWIDEALFGPPLKGDTYETNEGELLYEVSKGQVLKYIACSPLDPEGADVMDQLAPYFEVKHVR